MKAVLAIAVLAALAVSVMAECNNMCSGHGVCSTEDMCMCYRNWRGADCSERTCQFARSFVDTAQGDLNHDGVVEFASDDLNGDNSADTAISATNGEYVNAAANQLTDRFVTVRTQWRKSTFELFPASNVYHPVNHVYMECSNKGVCDRATGECACYEGYEGSACQRTVCPNACSGHGVCRNVKDMTQSAAVSTRGNYTYALWDATKIQNCVCDAGYSGYDCSERLCPKGDDPLTLGNAAGENDHVATIAVVSASAHVDATSAFTGNFKMQFIDAFGEEWTSAAVSPTNYQLDTTDDDLASALTGIPNSVIPSVTVTAAASASHGKTYSVTFTGNPGDQSDNFSVTQSTVTDWGAGAASTITVTAATAGDKTNTECSSRGMCDYTSGVCQCFRGYRLADCSGQSALAYNN